MTAVSSLASSVPSLPVPADFQAKLDAAVAEGARDSAAFAAEHTPAERWMIPDWSLLRMGWPPKTDAEDLKFLHALADSRTLEGIAAARYWAKHGLTDEWEKLLEDYTKSATPSQARSAKKLLHDSLMMVNNVTQTAKAAAGRQRPFVVDPTLKLAVDRPGNNPSYPSGHTTAAYAACMVLAHLMPERKAEFMKLAGEASWARLYGGVHFPTDVLAGAKMASTVVTYLTANTQAAPLHAKGKNTGVAGTRSALVGAVTLAGTRLAGPGMLLPSAA